MDLLRPFKSLISGEEYAEAYHDPVVERVNDTLTGSLVNRAELGNAGRDIAFYADTVYHDNPVNRATTGLYQNNGGDDTDAFIEVHFEIGEGVRCPGFSTHPQHYEAVGTLPPIEEIERNVIGVLEEEPELDYEPPRNSF
ncbi:MAG: hypothetical protein SVW02_04150 [Candidatus Nanohaloarchaea archaeon]|nr:hypothetical protein [Candidatus Nanohaloarchaea archaeon]